MKKIILINFIICFYSLIFFTVSAQKNNTRFTLSGKITTADNHAAMPGATIYISDLKAGKSSDENGNYILKDLPPGTYLVEAGFVGYKNILKTVTLNQNTALDFVMDVSITEVNEVIVTGTSKAMSIRRNPIPIISVNKQFLQQNLSTNIIDAIARVPGINAVTTGPNVSKPFIRGLGFNRILTLYDGVRQEGQQWGDEHGIEVDQNTVDKVEVVKGPASLIYGSDAVAGVVNLLPPNPPAEGKTIGEIVNEYQTNNRLIANSAMLAGHSKNYFVWMGRFSHKLATNYQNKIDGRVYNTGFSETDFSGMVGVNHSWGYSHLGFSIFDDLQEIPDGSRDSASRRFTKQITEADTVRPIVTDKELTSYHIPVLHQHVQHYRIYSANSFSVGGGRLVLNLAYQQSIRREFSHPQIIVPGLYLILNTFSYDVKYNFAEKNGWGVTAGVNGMDQNNNAEKGTEFIIPSYHQFDVGPFIFIKKTIKDLELAGGLRYDIRSFTNKELFTMADPVTGFDKPVPANTPGADQPFSAYQHTFSGMSGSFGLSYHFSDHLTGKFNIGRGFRAPNISEISANGVHPGTNSYQLGNLNFKPEFNLQEDFGINYNTPHFTLDAEVFNNNITNYIFNSKLLNKQGQDSIIVPGNETFQFLQGKAQLYGAEVSLDIHPHPLDWLHFENSLSVVYGTNKNATNLTKINDSSKYLPFIPPLHTFSELRANIKKVSKGIANGFIKIQLEHYSAQNRTYLAFGTETPTPGYQLFNAGLGGDIINKKGISVLTFSLLGNNLFDVAYQSHLNRLKYFEDFPDDPRPNHGIYNMGRNFSIKINVPL